MQAQSPKAPYIGLWSRLDGFRREQLTRAYERKRVVRSTLFRVTMQLVSTADHPSFAAVMHARWRDEFANWKLPADEWAARIVQLAEDGPFTYAAANAAVPELPDRYRWRVRCLTPLVHVPPAGTWGNHRIHVTTAERWLGPSRGGRAGRCGTGRPALPRRLRPGVEGRPAALRRRSAPVT